MTFKKKIVLCLLILIICINLIIFPSWFCNNFYIFPCGFMVSIVIHLYLWSIQLYFCDPVTVINWHMHCIPYLFGLFFCKSFIISDCPSDHTLSLLSVILQFYLINHLMYNGFSNKKQPQLTLNTCHAELKVIYK